MVTKKVDNKELKKETTEKDKRRDLIYIGKKDSKIYVDTISQTLKYYQSCDIESFFPYHKTHAESVVRVLEFLSGWNVEYEEVTHFIFKDRVDSDRKSAIMVTNIKVV
jgi:hypothetical protein